MFDRFKGASGTSTITAPLPTTDVADSPYAFVAVNLTLTFAPFGKLKGAAVRVVRGTEQVRAAMMAAEEPSQTSCG